MAELRPIAASYVAEGPAGVNIRTRVRNMSLRDETVLRRVAGHLGRLASRDLAVRVRDGLGHDSASWAARKQALTGESSSRWAGTITKASHDQWALARRGQAAHIRSLESGIRTIATRLNKPLEEKGTGREPGGYRSRKEWHAKKRRMLLLADRLDAARADHATGHVSVVRGGKKLANTRHHLARADITESQWRARWDAARWFLSADGESGKNLGNETIRIAPDGTVTIKLPAPLAGLANAPHGRYRLTGTAVFGYRGTEWAGRVTRNRAVAYRVHLDVTRRRWYIDASWQRPATPAVPLTALRAGKAVGVDTNADHLAAWQLDKHGNPVRTPRTFAYDLSGTADRRDAQARHAITRLLHWAKNNGATAIAIEDLNFTDSTTREKHGRRKRFRQLISGIPTGKLRARLLSMTTEAGISVIAVDPAYTSTWGAQHWQKPLAASHPQTTRHHAASVAIGRRALGHKIRRRTAPPRTHQSDVCGHRTIQAGPGEPRREETRHPSTGPHTRCVPPAGTTNAGNQATQHRSGPPTDQDSLLLSD